MHKFTLAILVAVDEMECELTLERIREDMVKAKRYGIRLNRPVGRPPREILASLKKYYPMWNRGYNSSGLRKVDWNQQANAV